MGTFDTRGGSPLSPAHGGAEPSALQEKILELLEARGIPQNINDQIMEWVETGELHADGSTFVPNGHKVNRPCPICTAPLTLDFEEALRQTHPGDSPLVRCEFCGHDELPREADIASLPCPKN